MVAYFFLLYNMGGLFSPFLVSYLIASHCIVLRSFAWYRNGMVLYGMELELEWCS